MKNFYMFFKCYLMTWKRFEIKKFLYFFIQNSRKILFVTFVTNCNLCYNDIDIPFGSHRKVFYKVYVVLISSKSGELFSKYTHIQFQKCWFEKNAFKVLLSQRKFCLPIFLKFLLKKKLADVFCCLLLCFPNFHQDVL